MPFLLFMPSFNQVHYIADAVRSVLAQDDPDWELWIVDNSTDNTPEVMHQFNDPRIQFHHIAERMDPGTCLNWMLERAIGRDFSYIHTDNNLHISYVRRMRAALEGHPLGLAYCDMRTIDETGNYIQVSRRGFFDLPRMLSTDPLGVPFAATMELAKRLGGFSVRDVADDVRFCAGAYGLAHYVHVVEPLVDYRNHGNSRTEQAGGGGQMQRIFIDLMPKILPTLEQRGLQPLLMLETAIREGLDAMDLFVEDLWYRKLSRWAPSWWQGYPRLDHFFNAGLLSMPDFSSPFDHPPLQLVIRGHDRRVQVPPWAMLMIWHYLYKRRRELRHLAKTPRRMLLTWACMKLGATSTTPVSIRVRNLDFRTLWAARQLEQALNWKPLIDPSISDPPKWLGWGKATGTEPLLDCCSEIHLSSDE
ncbi:MAG: glycosyltransferase family 2 protein [Steroidobacteraceae bacterium]